MKVYFPGGKRISAKYKGFSIETDQSLRSGGDEMYPNPFDLFKASLGTCMGYYAMAFCLERDIPVDQIWLEFGFEEEENIIQTISVKIIVDVRFPMKYLKSIVKATETCKIKKQLHCPPNYDIKAIYCLDE